MTMPIDILSTEYLRINRIIKNLNYYKISYDKGSSIRNNIDKALIELEKVKDEIGKKIDNR